MKDSFQRPRKVHRACKLAAEGHGPLSALCFKEPRSIYFASETWTLDAGEVTCAKCIRIMTANRLEGRAEDDPGGYVVRLEDDVWVAPWGSDPGRTLVRANAKVFRSIKSAAGALVAARKFRPFAEAVIERAYESCAREVGRAPKIDRISEQ